ncbi:group II intron reverse transcriptase/maturase (plasmid) [Agrobacterium leguminum]|uniref:group II intron reverse transcriptase/maturase n=1 Tax=Agrobacterium leguminum TaxID=2792015 RepID=UPI0027298F4C|nr:group II intron reverse transcriptase/maturase [Agrobacterium leguminum]WLE00854.1 group II intron reverse transcriptase/maturase [Agrobacterium leguminum]
MTAAVNTAFVLDMQRKLYRWSAADTNKVFADLFNLVCDPRMLLAAWQRLSRNRGSQTPGTDGMTRSKVESRPNGVEVFLTEIREELRGGTYSPEPVRQRLIPKPGKPGKTRPLGIPTLKDRLVQMALKQTMEPIFEADFYPTSYGFRPGRSTHDALVKCVRQLHPTRMGPSKYRYVIEGDIKGCFDAIDHHVLMERIRRRITDKKVLRLIHSFLKAGIMAEGTVRHSVAGTPQGGVISPMLANIYLTAIDERYGRWTLRPRETPRAAALRRLYDRKRGKAAFFAVRYADDFVVFTDATREGAENERHALAEFLKQELRMELSMEKTKITMVEEGFDFLGYRVAQERARHTGRMVGKPTIPRAKLKDLRHKIKVMVREFPTGESLSRLIGKLNPLITGWRNYYRHAMGAYDDFVGLDWWLAQRIDRWMRKKYRKVNARDIRRRYAAGTGKNRNRWAQGTAKLRLFREGGTDRFPHRGIQIPNGWNDEPEREYLRGDPKFWQSYRTLAQM